MVEYIIIVALVAVAAIGSYSFFGETIQHQVASLAGEISGHDQAAAATENAKKSAEAAEASAAVKSNMSTFHDSAKVQ